MNLEEEKMLVAEKLMGWKYVPEREGTMTTRGEVARFDKEKPIKNECYRWIWVQDWHPEKDRNCWPEIWEKMNEDRVIDYLNSLYELLEVNLSGAEHWEHFHNHTAPSKICWKALIKTLKEL